MTRGRRGGVLQRTGTWRSKRPEYRLLSPRIGHIARPPAGKAETKAARRGGRAGPHIIAFVIERFHREPAVGIEPTTARLRIECSTTELRWRSLHRHRCHCTWSPLHALARTRTATPYGTTPSRWRVYQFHHQGATHAVRQARTATDTGLTGLEPATSGVTDRHSNQAELQPQLLWRLTAFPTSRSISPPPLPHSPKGSRTPLCTLKECRPNR